MWSSQANQGAMRGNKGNCLHPYCCWVDSWHYVIHCYTLPHLISCLGAPVCVSFCFMHLTLSKFNTFCSMHNTVQYRILHIYLIQEITCFYCNETITYYNTFSKIGLVCQKSNYISARNIWGGLFLNLLGKFYAMKPQPTISWIKEQLPQYHFIHQHTKRLLLLFMGMFSNVGYYIHHMLIIQYKMVKMLNNVTYYFHASTTEHLAK